jgi:putative tryptophan/tyrosine transport system substrate-binding protein
MLFDRLRRREFIALAGGAAAWPLTARAQPTDRSARRIGVFGATAENPVMGGATRAFFDELRRNGFVEGRNLVVDLKSTDQDVSRFADQAIEMVRANPDALVALGSEVVLQACVQASRTIPIVFVANNYDPIARGYVKSLANPGSNATGVVLRQTELAEKQVELLTEVFPNRTRLGVMWDSVSADQFSAAKRRAELLKLSLHSSKMENPPYDFETSFRSLGEFGADMLLVLTSQFFAQRRDQLVAETLRRRVPAMFIFRSYVDAGGLLSYGADNIAMYRQGGTFVSKILKGAKPADLPVEQPTKYDMVLNLKTAKEIGVELPTSVLLRADEVIE